MVTTPKAGLEPENIVVEVTAVDALCVLHISSKYLFDRRNDEIRLVELDIVPTAGGNYLCTIGRETDEILLQG